MPPLNDQAQEDGLTLVHRHGPWMTTTTTRPLGSVVESKELDILDTTKLGLEYLKMHKICCGS